MRTHLAMKAFTLRKQLGRDPLANELGKGKPYKKSPYAAFFGEYETFCTEMNFDFFTDSYRVDEEFTADSLLKIIRMVSFVLGQSPSMQQFELISGLHIKHIKKHFRNFSTAVMNADIPVPSRSAHYSNQQLLRVLYEIGRKNNRVPRAGDIRKLGLPSVRIYKLRFGSFRKSLIAAGYELSPKPPKKSSTDRKKKHLSTLLKTLGD